MKRLAAVGGWLCVVSTLVAACAGDSGDGSTQGPTSAASQSDESEEGPDTSDDGASTTASDEASTGAATSGTSDGGTSASVQPEVCAQMFRCLADVAPEVAAPLLELYGEQGSCWQLGPDEQAICEAACEGQLQVAYEAGLWDQRVCAGVFQPEPTGTKGPETTDAACSDMFDNDSDGFVDCDDFDCSMDPTITVCGASTE